MGADGNVGWTVLSGIGVPVSIAPLELEAASGSLLAAIACYKRRGDRNKSGDNVKADDSSVTVVVASNFSYRRVTQ